MALIVVEREFSTPAQFAARKAQEDAANAGLSSQRVCFVHSYFSLCRTRMTCFYDSRDAESVRVSQRAAGLPFTRVWAAQSAHFADALPIPPGFSSMVVERDLSDAISLEQIAAQVRDGAACLGIHRVMPVASFLSPDGRRGICICVATDAESVRLANRQLELSFTRAWAATFHPAAAAQGLTPGAGSLPR